MYGGPPACGRLANSVTRSESCRTLGIPTRSVASHCCTSEPIPCGASLTRLENAVLPCRCAELPGLLHLSAVIELVTQVIADQVGVQLAAALHWSALSTSMLSGRGIGDAPALTNRNRQVEPALWLREVGLERNEPRRSGRDDLDGAAARLAGLHHHTVGAYHPDIQSQAPAVRRLPSTGPANKTISVSTKVVRSRYL
jgi:hypothetical protein